MSKIFTGNSVENAILPDDGAPVDVVDQFGFPIYRGVSERDVWDVIDELPASAIVIYGNGAEHSIRYWAPACALADR